MKSKVERKAAAAGAVKDGAREPTFDNRRARFEYEKLESLEVGVALQGTEIKSIRNGNLSLNEGYARMRDGELWLVNFTIPPYKEGSIFNHEPGRPRKLLLHKEQMSRLMARAAEKGLTLIPLRLYFKRGRVKLELGLMRGKKVWDKRQTIAERDAKRDLARERAAH
jgi:SsrA-binding protein